MKKQFLYSVGIDVSKETFDVVVLNFLDMEKLFSESFKNNKKGAKSLLSWLSQHKVELGESLFCMEATGRHSEKIADFLCEQNLATWVGHPGKMSKILSSYRGKSDRLDALKIAQYAIRYVDEYRAYLPLSLSLKKIRDLCTLRRLLKKTQSQTGNLLGALKNGDTTGDMNELANLLTPTQEAKKEAIIHIEKKIKEILKADSRLWKIYQLIISVKGVGLVTASYLLVVTRGFTRFKTVKELACFCSIAPFVYESGTSVKKRTRIHHAGDKKLKTLLHMCALNAIRFDPGIKAFHERRLAKGKHKMSELNVVRNKVLTRIWSCVIREQKYVIRMSNESAVPLKNKAA